MQRVEIDVGRVVAGKYELVRLIGKGAMGEVWLATHNSLGGEFAVKLVRPGGAEQDESAAGRFQLEAQVSAKLSRKTRHIVSVSDHGEEEDGLAYLVMELLEGESLEARITGRGEVDLAEVVAIVMQIARALGQAHAEGIFHRDLKPANVFITRDEDGRLLVKLLDFGIARSQKPFNTRSPFVTGKDMVLGTPCYMSPEQARGLDSLDHRCDLWALSVVAYEALTRAIPWEGETIEDVFLSICTHRMIPILSRRADLPPVIESVFARSFAPGLDERFRTASELSAAFENLVDPMAVEAAMRGTRATPSSRPLPLAPSRPGSFSDAGAMAIGQRDAAADPMGLLVGEGTMSTPKNKSAGWRIAAIAALVTVGIVGLAISAFSSRDGKATTKSPPADPTTVTAPPNDRASIPPPEEAPAASTLVVQPVAPSTSAKTVSGAKATRTPTGKASPPPPVVPPTPATPATAAPATPVAAPHPTPATPAPPPPTTATPAKPPDKSGVF